MHGTTAIKPMCSSPFEPPIWTLFSAFKDAFITPLLKNNDLDPADVIIIIINEFQSDAIVVFHEDCRAAEIFLITHLFTYFYLLMQVRANLTVLVLGFTVLVSILSLGTYFLASITACRPIGVGLSRVRLCDRGSF